MPPKGKAGNQESAGAMIEWVWCKRTGKDYALYLDMKEGGVG